MNFSEYKNSFFDFLESSPTAFHTVAALKDRLVNEGYGELPERGGWRLSDGGKYFTTKNGSSLIAFRAVKNAYGFMICASHSDTPSFRVKKSFTSDSAYVRLPVERYGGAILYSWLDRPLSIAGRVLVKTDNGVKNQLVNIKRDLFVIPSVAIHQKRDINEKFSPNPAVDMIPLFSTQPGAASPESIVAEEIGAEEKNVISHDLFLYSRNLPTTVGKDGELVLSPRLDDIGCVYSSLEAFLKADNAKSVPVLAVFDNEEVGSETKQGAASDFLIATLERIAGSSEACRSMLCDSFMVSADNAHARHPNHPELSDVDAPILNKGIVIKYNASQRYATDGVSSAIFKLICDKCGAATQSYYNRADMPGGSTLGSIANTKASLPTVDIGLPQLAMHSAVETCGAEDIPEMIKALTAFYSTAIKVDGEEIKLV